MGKVIFLVFSWFAYFWESQAQKPDNLGPSHVCPSNESRSYVWCVPHDYDRQDGPFKHTGKELASVLPWNYHFDFKVKEVSKVIDNDRSLILSMYFGTSWKEPRLRINESDPQWADTKIGPMNQITISSDYLEHFWYPELEIYGLEDIVQHKIIKNHEMAGIRIGKDQLIYYEVNVKIRISCQMHFRKYPFDEHDCPFRVGSYYGTNRMISCTSNFTYHEEMQRHLQHYVKLINLSEDDKTVDLDSGSYSVCGFQINLQRKTQQFIIQHHIPTFIIVLVSWVSFLISPKIIPARMALLVTVFLCLTNLFDGVKDNAPASAQLNAIDIYVVSCFFFVFAALMEYAIVLTLLKKLNKPKFMAFLYPSEGKRKTKNSTLQISQGIEDCFKNDHSGKNELVRHSHANANDLTEEPNQDRVFKERNKSNVDKKEKNDRGQEMEEICTSLDNVTFWILIILFTIFHIVYISHYLSNVQL